MGQGGEAHVHPHTRWSPSVQGDRGSRSAGGNPAAALRVGPGRFRRVSVGAVALACHGRAGGGQKAVRQGGRPRRLCAAQGCSSRNSLNAVPPDVAGVDPASREMWPVARPRSGHDHEAQAPVTTAGTGPRADHGTSARTAVGSDHSCMSPDHYQARRACRGSESLSLCVIETRLYVIALAEPGGQSYWSPGRRRRGLTTASRRPPGVRAASTVTRLSCVLPAQRQCTCVLGDSLHG